jgi:hypothetical protein
VIPSLASTVLVTISLPTLQRLHLFRIWELPASVVLHAASSVRVLSLNRVSPCIPKDTPADIAPNIHLENFILPSCLTTQALLRACNFLLTAQTLRRLAADANTAYYHTLATSSSAHLRHLVLECGSGSPIIPDFSPLIDIPPSIFDSAGSPASAGAPIHHAHRYQVRKLGRALAASLEPHPRNRRPPSIRARPRGPYINNSYPASRCQWRAVMGRL